MAKIITSITYNNYICEFIKTIGNLSFYSYTEKDDEKLLIVNKDTNDVLAVVIACMADGIIMYAPPQPRLRRNP